MFSFSTPAKVALKISWMGDISMSKFTNSLWKEYNETNYENRTDRTDTLVSFFFFYYYSAFIG